MEFLNNLKYAWRFAKYQKKYMIFYVLTSIISVALSVVFPILSAKVILYLTDNMLYQLILIALVIFGCEILWDAVDSLSRWLASIIYRETFTKVQTELGSNILKLTNSTLDANSSGVFIERMNGDTNKLADIFCMLNDYITGIVSNIGVFAAIFILNKWLFLYSAIMMIIIYLVEKTRVKVRNNKDEVYRKEREKATGFVGEISRGVRDIKMLNAEESFIGELHKKLVSLNKSRYDMQKYDRGYRFLRNALVDLYDLLLILLLVYMIYHGYLAVASALVAYNYSSRVMNFVYYGGEFFQTIKDFNLSASRIFAIMEGNEFPKETFGKKHLDKINGDFEFKNVKFSYGKEKVLKGLSFKINANETVAFVGKSGAGKTTIFNLLCKMYDVDSGTITIDGVDIRKLDRESIRGNITIISQDPYIFNVSIRDNLKLVKNDATEEEIEEACKLACLDEFINSLPDGYDTIIGEGGVNLSGGQRQRIAIARALVQKTEIILFDEATSALDNETQTHIQQAIENMKDEYTILIIAHRLSTIINADRIMFLNDGKIEAVGNHKELLKTCPEYKKLYEAEILKED